jgi:aspartate-semialdehyde dehydrogenase
MAFVPHNPLVGLVGWRGMVGSVLMDRMQAEGDFALIEPLFFSTSNAGGAAPAMAKNEKKLFDASDLTALKRCDVIITAQGGEYTKAIYPQLRAQGWKGYWIDAAKTLRMNDDAVIVLDPVNLNVVKAALTQGVKNYIGGNCTVSCMLMGLGALFKADLVEWMACTTYQAASGGGAQHMRELLTQYGTLNASVKSLLDNPASAILDIDRQVVAAQRALTAKETENFLVPLGGSLIPWIDSDRNDGTSLEEWKAGAETNKILGVGPTFGTQAVPIDSLCVRVGAMRCHSQAVTIKLKRDVPLADIEHMVANDNAWVKLVPNTKEASIRELTPVAVSARCQFPWVVCANWRWGRSTWAPSPSATSCCGVRPNRCAACCAFYWSGRCACPRRAGRQRVATKRQRRCLTTTHQKVCRSVASRHKG